MDVRHLLFLYNPWTDNSETPVGDLNIEYIVSPSYRGAIKTFIEMSQDQDKEEIRVFLFNYIRSKIDEGEIDDVRLRSAFIKNDLFRSDDPRIRDIIMNNFKSIVDLLEDAEDEWFTVRDLPNSVYNHKLVPLKEPM